MTFMFVVLGVLLVGVGFGFLGKSKEALLQHRWTLTTVLILMQIPLAFVIVPTMYRFYTDPDVWSSQASP
jgi:hypothetical protein